MGWVEPYQVEIHNWFANASRMEYPLGATQPGLENSLAEKDLKTLEVFSNLSDSLSQQHVLAAKASCTLSCSSKSVANRSGQVIHPFCLQLLGIHLSAPSNFGHPTTRRHQCAGGGSVQGCQEGRRLESTRAVKRGWGNYKKKRVRRGQSSDCNQVKEGDTEDRAREFSEVHWGRMIGDRWKLEQKTF